MKRICLLLFLFMLMNTPLSAQSLTVFDIDDSNFPLMKAKFYAFDENGNQVTNLSPSDFKLTENGEERTVTNVSCPSPKQIIPLSIAMSIDKSGSMSNPYFDVIPIDNARITAIELIKSLINGTNEMAIQECDQRAYIIHDFTKDKNKLIQSVSEIPVGGGNDFVEQFINERTGLFNIAKTGKYKRIAIVYTDAWCYALSQNELEKCIDICKKYDIAFYGIIFTRPDAEPYGIKSSIKAIAEKTGGIIYDGITSSEAAILIANILKSDFNYDPCVIEWESNYSCEQETINIEISWNNLKFKTSYETPILAIKKLVIFPSGIYFKNKTPGIKVDTTITINAINSDFSITDITCSSPYFSISPTSFILNSGQSQELTLSFTPPDSNYYICIFDIINDKCHNEYYVAGGFSKKKSNKKTLKLTYPNGGEKFLVGSDTIITWEGVLPNDTVRLEYSIDNGLNWNLITNSATGLKYIWKKIPDTPSEYCLAKVSQIGNFEEPNIEWQKCYGGSSDDRAHSIQQTNDGGYIIAGDTKSNDKDVTGNHGGLCGYDYWVLKLDKQGNILWQKCLGGSSDDVAYSVKETDDGGFLVVGGSFSINGDITNHHGDYNSSDTWIIKLDYFGNIEWQKSYGGSYSEGGYTIQLTNDGGYVISGYSCSNNEDLTKNYGQADYWILKLDEKGTIQWQKSYGGNKKDFAFSVQQTNDEGYIVAGWTESNNCDVEKNYGYRDYWILKLDIFGNIIWRKSIGGGDVDEVESIQLTDDGRFIVAGSTKSKNGIVLNNYGLFDYWIVKLDEKGNIVWQKSFGGSRNDLTKSIDKTYDGGFIISGTTESYDHDITKNFGANDFWILKLDNLGNLSWQKTFGGTNDDVANCIQQTYDYGYIIAGYTGSNNIDVKGNHGYLDVWVVKLNPDCSIIQEDISDSLWAIVKPEVQSIDIDMKQCIVGDTKDSIITAFLSNTGTYPIRIDTVFFEGTDYDQFKILNNYYPITIEPNDTKTAEFLFFPASVGLKTSQIKIVTQADTLTKNIRGEGVQPAIQVMNNWIDFGVVEIGNNKDTLQAFTIKNVSNVPITINSTNHSKLNDYDFTTLNDISSQILQVNDILKMDLRFTPSSVGRTSGVLEIHYDNVCSPAIVQLFGQGIGGSIRLNDDSAYAGDKLNLQLDLLNKIFPKTQDISTGYKVRISYNPTLLAFIDSRAIIKSGISRDTVEMSTNWDGINNVLGEFEIISGLGNAETTDLIIEDFHWLDKNGKEIEFDVDIINGTFKLLGLCREGGTRLVNPLANTSLISIIPNPAQDEICITINNSENGDTYLTIYNYLGIEVIKKRVESETYGTKEIKFNVSELSNGVYYIKYQTPTYFEYEKVVIGR